MAIPRIMVIQPDQTPVTLTHRNGTYRQTVTLLTIFNPKCLALDPKDVVTYEEIAPYTHSSKNLTWLLVGLSIGILTNVYGLPDIWPFAFVIFTFALASIIFSTHSTAKQKLFQLGLTDGRRLIAAIDAEHIGQMNRQFPNALETTPDGLYTDNLNPQEQLHAEKIRYGLVTVMASASTLQLSRNLISTDGYINDIGSMLTLGILIILVGLIAVSIVKLLKVGRIQPTS